MDGIGNCHRIKGQTGDSLPPGICSPYWKRGGKRSSGSIFDQPQKYETEVAALRRDTIEFMWLSRFKKFNFENRDLYDPEYFYRDGAHPEE